MSSILWYLINKWILKSFNMFISKISLLFFANTDPVLIILQHQLCQLIGFSWVGRKDYDCWMHIAFLGIIITHVFSVFCMFYECYMVVESIHHKIIWSIIVFFFLSPSNIRKGHAIFVVLFYLASYNHKNLHHSLPNNTFIFLASNASFCLYIINKHDEDVCDTDYNFFLLLVRALFGRWLRILFIWVWPRIDICIIEYIILSSVVFIWEYLVSLLYACKFIFAMYINIWMIFFCQW